MLIWSIALFYSVQSSHYVKIVLNIFCLSFVHYSFAVFNKIEHNSYVEQIIKIMANNNIIKQALECSKASLPMDLCLCRQQPLKRSVSMIMIPLLDNELYILCALLRKHNQDFIKSYISNDASYEQ